MYRLNEESIHRHNSLYPAESRAQASCILNKPIPHIVNSNYLESEMEVSNQDLPMDFDPNRRSSLGAESLMEHDINEEMGNLDDCSESIYSEAHLGLEYADDIFMLHKSQESIFHPQNYIQKQPRITEYMRCTLINWLVKVSHELKFGPETIFIAVNLTDRFLESTPIAQDCLQLLAVCALFIAAKLEETVVPGITALVKLCGSAYRHYHFKRMESLLLSTLRFRLHSPTSWFFVTYITLKSCHSIQLDKRALCLARYTIETCLGNYRISQYFPSEQAASALTFSCLVLYSPNSVYALQTIDSSSEISKECENYQEGNIFDILSSLNEFSSHVLWTLRERFSSEESKNIKSCFELMKDYMKPFLQSSDSGFSFLNANLPSSIKNSTSTPQEKKETIIQKPDEMCKTVFRSVYNEDKEELERVVETYATSSKYSPYSLNCSSGRRYEKYRNSRDKYISKWDAHTPSKGKRTKDKGGDTSSLYDYVLQRKGGSSLPSDWNIT